MATWKGPNISNELDNLLIGTSTESGNIGTFCTKNTDNLSNLPKSTQTSQVNFDPNPYGAFNCDMFAVLSKPKTNPLTFRGTTNNDYLYGWQQVDDNKKLCTNWNCENKVEHLCSHDFNNCNVDSPGGLADFMGKPPVISTSEVTIATPATGNITVNLPTVNDMMKSQVHSLKMENGKYIGNYEKPIKITGSENYLKNGFIIDDCECNDKIRVFNELEKDNTGDVLGAISPNIDLESPLVPLASEIWNGNVQTDVFGGIMSTNCDTLSHDYSCIDYIRKLAHTCSWCKNATLWVPSDIPGSETECSTDPNSKQYGNCFGIGPNGKPRLDCVTVTNDEVTSNTGRCPILDRFWKPNETGDCQICDSPFWNYIPGGWQAIVDENHPLHFYAMNAYDKKHQHINDNTNVQNSNENCCKQPNDDEYLNVRVSGVNDPCPLGNNECGSGQTLGGECLHGETTYCGRNTSKGNVITGAFGNQQGMFDIIWDQNECGNLCTNCSVMDWNSLLEDNQVGPGGILDRIKINFGIDPNIEVSNISTCPEIDGRTQNAHLMCKRSKFLTLKGESHEENAELATYWMNGSINENIHDPTATEDARRERTIKAMRCCIGASPGFKTVDKNSPSPDQLDVTERWTRDECPAASVCASSDFCKNLFTEVMTGNNANVKMDLNDFGAAEYPSNFKLENINDTSSSATTEVMENPAWYAKAYCELMGGGKSLSSGVKGVDDDINTLCRKTMYNYCVNPVEVEVNDSEKDKYAFDKYTLPLNIFSEGCYNWFTGKLEKSLPSDYGTRDMALGSSCQKMQIEGWVYPTDPQNSPLIKAFTTTENGDEVITDTSGRKIKINFSPHQGAKENINRSCGCFYTGSNCSGGNCSYYYCGAGENEVIEATGVTEVTETFNNLQKSVNLSGYIDGKSWTKYQNKIAPSWENGLDASNFTCIRSSNPPKGTIFDGSTDTIDGTHGYSGCYKNCNYVNSYDVCWNASPSERKYSTEYENWTCDENDPSGDSCTRYAKDVYGCFGPCPIGQDGLPNCGTEDWFAKPTGDRKPVTPNESKKNNSSILEAADYPQWQNFYSEAGAITEATIPGWGGKLSQQGDGRAAFGACSDAYSVKPYGVSFLAPSGCFINQNTTVNNNGIIVGSINISQFSKCEMEGDLSAFNSSTSQTNSNRHKFLQYMGNVKCQGEDCDIPTNEICIDSETGDNCTWCGSTQNNMVQFSAPDKPNTCCLDPSLVSEENRSDDIQVVGKNISYICWATDENGQKCPAGTVSLSDLEAQCEKPCSEYDQISCEDCQYCSWVGDSCRATCPTAPKEGWADFTLPPTPEPTTEPTSTGEISGSKSGLTSEQSLGIGLGLGIPGLIFIGLLIWYFTKKTKAYNTFKKNP